MFQNINTDYDTYDTCVVCAENEDEAKKIHPASDFDCFDIPSDWWKYGTENNLSEKFDWMDLPDDKDFDAARTWVININNIQIKYIGEADTSVTKGVVCASFNAG